MTRKVVLLLLTWLATSWVWAAGGEVVSRQSDTLPDVPQRIISLDDITTEILLALGVKPVGVANVSSYNRQGKPLREHLKGIPSLGSGQQPNLERLVALEPDLIMGTSSVHAALFQRLNSLAPTILYDVSLEPTPDDAVAVGIALMEHVAGLTGTEEKAQEVRAELEAVLTEGRRVAEKTGLVGRPVSVLYPLPDQGLFIVSNEKTLVVSLANRLGGTNPWPLQDSSVIHKRIELHALAREPDLRLFFIGNFKGNTMFDSSLWQAIPVAGRSHYGFLPTDYWSFGGPLSAMEIMSQMIELMPEMEGRVERSVVSHSGGNSSDNH